MNSEQRLLTKFIQKHTDDALIIIEKLTDAEIAAFLESLPQELSVLLLKRMDRFKASRSLENMELKNTVKIIEKLPIPIAEILMRLTDKALCDKILEGLPAQPSRLLQRILKYSTNKVGAFINPAVFTLYEDHTVNRALEKIKKTKLPLFSKVFILNREQYLVGLIELKELIINDENKLIRSVMNTNTTKINANINIDSLMEKGVSETFSMLPVVDETGIFLGIITKEALFNKSTKKDTFDHQAFRTGAALGELYKIGLASFLDNTSETDTNS